MYQKIHKRFTLMFTGVASLILISLSASCLYLSEQALQKNSFQSFSEEMNTIVSHLEQQTVISHEWLAKVSRNGRYLLAVYDHDVPLTYTRFLLSEQDLALISEVKKNCADSLRSVPSSGYFTSLHQEFTYTSSRKEQCYVCYVHIRQAASLTALILHPTEELSRQLMISRICFFVLDLTGILLLFLFSRSYTRRLLSPIQQAQEGQTAFIAAASHELQTPLSVILSSISALKCAQSDQKDHFLTTIEKESRLMSRLVTDLLTLSRADSHTWTFHWKEAELDTVLLNACETFRPFAAKKQISMSAEFTEDLFPPCICDEERILQVFSILISNAISYGKLGGYVKLKLSFYNHIFLLQVMDNGIGISKEAKEHIFERFYRADPSRSKKEHLGLGLCIAKEIVEAHHGSIAVSDTPGGGTIFTVKLPQEASFSS